MHYNDLSVENPVAYDPDGNCFWLYYDPQILSYAFYDHKGVYHVFNMDRLRETRAITIGDTITLLDEEIYFKNEWGINVMVNYQTSAVDVTVKFNYGEDLYLLPNYDFKNRVVTTLTSRIGNTFEILTGEKYMKVNYIFTGWQIAGDDSGHLYCSGEKFTIPNFDTENQSAVIEFVAVWHLQRLLFDFDFDGGSWQTAEGPDFTLMKGAYGDRVRIVNEKPVKFGYDFVGWTLDGESEMLQPNDYILVGTKFQILHANWEPKRLRVLFFIKYDAGDNWAPRGNYVTDINGETLYSGGTVELPGIPDNKFYIANGWQIGNHVIDNDTRRYQLTTQVLSQLETVLKEENGNSVLETHIYASQTKRTLDVEYDFTVGAAGNYIDISGNVDTTRLVSVLPQGDLFYDYYPFSVIRDNGNYGVFDTDGRQFVSWSYTTDGRTYVPIIFDTEIPTGFKKITIRGNLSESKSVSVEFYNHHAEYLKTDTGSVGHYNYGNSFELPNYDDLNISGEINDWGTFVGWSIEPDYKSGNPKVIYDVYYYRQQNGSNPQLQLFNVNDMTSAPYKINIDRYATQTLGMNYTLRLFAVYAKDYAQITYSNLRVTNLDGTVAEVAQLKLPVFSNENYTQTKIGGRTVDRDADNFADYGLTVLDDNGLTMWSGTNFIGWEAILPEGVSEELQTLLANRIWFPGDYLPSFDFDFTFRPIRITQSNEVQEYVVGNRTYRILSLSNYMRRIKYTGSVDIVALPRDSYTVKQGDIVITSDREVHVIVPAEGNIVLEPRAIQCNTIREFYVSDNLTITGSPVVGTNFQSYRVKKGYRVTGENGVPTVIHNATTKYDFNASLSGLLISHDGTTLYSVPCHSVLTTENLLDLVQSITHITTFALADINNLTTINLSKNTNLQIDAEALYNVNAKNIILPASVAYDASLVIDPQVLSGALTNLTSVTFGDATTTSTWYAFVDRGYVYYIDNLSMPNAKSHLMYVLRTVQLDNLDYINNNLSIEDSVSVIEPHALMGLDWKKINSVTANNPAINLTTLVGVPTDIPLFTDANNPYQGPMVQPYLKTFRFTYKGGEAVEVKFAYGQTFRVFSAQKNNYRIFYNRPWSQFVAWKLNNRVMLHVGEIYKVGIDDTIIGDKYTLQFDASSADSWQQYPVQLMTYNDAYQPEDFTFDDIDDNSYTLSDLLDCNFLNNVYLPGLDHEVTVGNSKYRFIGWSTKTMKTNTSIPNLWNSVDLEYRVLPNHTASTTLNSGSLNSEGIYIYYALYEKITPNIEYSLLADGTYAVTGLTITNVDSLNIPFAKYHNGYMVPVTKINDNVFSGVTNINEIAIGGAVSEIGKHSFNGVNAEQINFAHKGRNIFYNYRQSTATKQLKILDYAFANNSAITNLVLPAAVETLGEGAFQSCIKLYGVTFENGYSPYLRNIGNSVFRDNYAMKDNAIIRLLTDDGKNGNNRFITVGDGIFRNTSVTSVDGTNKIVWRDTLLHAYYPNGSDTELAFNEKYIAGYAFVNLGSTDSSVQISIDFKNPNVQIKANAFSNLNGSINKIYLNSVVNGKAIDINHVDINAFDSITHPVDIYVNSRTAWNKKYEELLKNSTTLRFV
ncbi:MAG: leucine-rich repeat domain-containing protein [Clostridia bacterium]|nr:leucine-rich repeat domain-containing protein [Clostridia bacterium]